MPPIYNDYRYLEIDKKFHNSFIISNDAYDANGYVVLRYLYTLYIGVHDTLMVCIDRMCNLRILIRDIIPSLRSNDCFVLKNTTYNVVTCASVHIRNHYCLPKMGMNIIDADQVILEGKDQEIVAFLGSVENPKYERVL